jgi:isocitrate lyase
MSANGTNGHSKNGNSHADWTTNPRWSGIARPYSYEDVLRLRGTIQIEYTLARLGAERLWHLMHTDPYVAALGALTGNQAIEMVQAGLKAIYGSGWQVAADANTAGDVYPDQSLYPCDSAPALVKRINRALLRADQIESVDRSAVTLHGDRSAVTGNGEGKKSATYWFAPIVADAEAGFGGSLNAYELMKAMIEAGAAGVHFEDQLSSAKKCGHLGGKVVVPIREFIEKLTAARLAADVCGTPTILIARTDANSAGLLLSDADPRDREFIHGDRTAEGFFQFRGGIEAAIARGLAYAPYADMLWCETSTPDLAEAKKFADAIHAQFPGKLLAYNCSPSFNWKKKLDDATIANFQCELGKMGYKFQFVTLAGFHALNMSMFHLARGYAQSGMTAYSKLQQEESAAQELGYRAVTHQRFVGTGYFDEIAQVISGGHSSTTALAGSTEAAQFHRDHAHDAHGNGSNGNSSKQPVPGGPAL